MYEADSPRYIVTRTRVYAVPAPNSTDNEPVDPEGIRCIPKGTRGRLVHQYCNTYGIVISVVCFGDAYAYLGPSVWDAA
jgi:hypothetical protein